MLLFLEGGLGQRFISVVNFFFFYYELALLGNKMIQRTLVIVGRFENNNLLKESKKKKGKENQELLKSRSECKKTCKILNLLKRVIDRSSQ